MAVIFLYRDSHNRGKLNFNEEVQQANAKKVLNYIKVYILR